MEYGKYNELEVLSKDKWFYELEGGVKLPFDACADVEIKIGEKVNPFVYMDIEKGVMGTLGTVFGQVGELAYLHVVATSEMGAFLDLGIGKDVLLLKNKMEVEAKEGDDILVALILDNKNRIGAFEPPLNVLLDPADKPRDDNFFTLYPASVLLASRPMSLCLELQLVFVAV